jgi:hypothetical protein
MTAPKVSAISSDPSDGEVGDALAIQTPLTIPRSVEELVTAALVNGFPANFDEWREKKPDVASESDVAWQEARTLQGEFVVALCTSAKKGTHSFPRGIRIKGARIQGDIDLTTVSIDVLLVLERCRIEGHVLLRDCTARLINFASSYVCGEVSGDRFRATAGVHLRKGFTSEGAIRLSGAVIDGDLDFSGATILNQKEKRLPRKLKPDENYALRLDRARVKGSIFLRNIDATGPVRLLDTEVGGNVELEGTTLKSPGEDALLADNARIAGSLVLRDWKAQPQGMISVRNASAGVLQLGAYDDKRWPAKDTVRGQGFRYGTIETEGLVSRGLCERWLDLLVLMPFTSQPYEKCAQVLRENGLADDAKEIAIRRRRDQRDAAKLSGWQRTVDVLLDKSIGYGYRPVRSVSYLAIIALIGTLVFGVAQWTDAMIPADNALARVYRAHPDSMPPGYPPLVAPVYSLDVLLPIIDFQQDSKWRPDRGAMIAMSATRGFPIGWIALAWSWIQIVLGWVLSTLLVGSVTGLIRKE